MKDSLGKRIKITWKLHHQKYLLIMPFGILFIAFVALPVLISVGLSFTYFNMLQPPSFVGLEHYVNLLVKDEIFLIAIKNTLLLALITGPLSYLLCFVLAWIINDFRPKVRAILTLVFYIPSIAGNAFLIWGLIFSSDMYGYANAWLMQLGILSEPKLMVISY